MDNRGFEIRDEVYGRVRGIIEPDGTPLYCCLDVAMLTGVKAPGKLVSKMKQQNLVAEKRWIDGEPGSFKPIVFANCCDKENALKILDRVPTMNEAGKWFINRVVPEATKIGKKKKEANR